MRLPDLKSAVEMFKRIAPGQRYPILTEDLEPLLAAAEECEQLRKLLAGEERITYTGIVEEHDLNNALGLLRSENERLRAELAEEKRLRKLTIGAATDIGKILTEAFE